MPLRHTDGSAPDAVCPPWELDRLRADAALAGAVASLTARDRVPRRSFGLDARLLAADLRAQERAAASRGGNELGPMPRPAAVVARGIGS